ncbi:site-specific integrase [Moritella dasanensis]|uniref:site-specific integrase n=1 Tax=Moritella dasanensis TaxID=428031 RepID=UPI0002FF2A11|nr:site-specific integrase [Moritella dasanensis]
MCSISIEKANPQKEYCKKFKIRIKPARKDPISGQKTRVFKTYSQAASYKTKITTQIENNDFSFFIGMNKKLSTIGDIVNDCLRISIMSDDLNPKIKPILALMLTTPIAKVPADQLIANDWYCLGRYLKSTLNIRPQTVAGYLSVLHSTLRDSVTILCHKVALDSYSIGVSTLRRKGYVSRSETRTRRITKDEVAIIKSALLVRDTNPRTTIRMTDIFEFAIETAARLSEICVSITWGDWDSENRTLTIRNRKTPKCGQQINSTFELSSRAIEILMQQPRQSDDSRIFPYNPQSVGATWHKVMKELGIEDLHFHDLRAEGLCRLYEAGWNIVSISKVSGHRDLNILNNFYLRVYPTQLSLFMD